MAVAYVRCARRHASEHRVLLSERRCLELDGQRDVRTHQRWLLGRLDEAIARTAPHTEVHAAAASRSLLALLDSQFFWLKEAVPPDEASIGSEDMALRSVAMVLAGFAPTALAGFAPKSLAGLARQGARGPARRHASAAALVGLQAAD